MDKGDWCLLIEILSMAILTFAVVKFGKTTPTRIVGVAILVVWFLISEKIVRKILK